MSARATLALAAFSVAAGLISACGDDDSSESASASPADSATSTGGNEALFTIALTDDVAPGWPYTLASGDFNSDGVTDLLLGAPLADGPGDARIDAGEAYVFFGPLEGNVDLAGEADLRIFGAVSGDNLGGGVAAGDLNADGTDDVIVGASGSNALENLRTDMGEAFVIFGGPDLAGEIDALGAEQDFTLQPAEGFSQLGRALAAGDVNGDGVDDLVAGAPYAGRLPNTPPGSPRTTVGEVYVVFGRSGLRGVVSVVRDEEDLRFAGEREFDQFGATVALADVDGDAVVDIVVGASGYDGLAGDRDAAGAVFIFEEAAAQGVQTIEDADVVIVGETAESLGTLVATTSESSIWVSAPTAHGPETPSSGRICAFPGPGLEPQIDLQEAGCPAELSGGSTGALFPASLTGSGDRIAAGGGSQHEGAPGVFLVRGELNTDGQPPPFTERSGDALHFGDFDGDGTPELLILTAGSPQQLTALRTDR